MVAEEDSSRRVIDGPPVKASSCGRSSTASGKQRTLFGAVREGTKVARAVQRRHSSGGGPANGCEQHLQGSTDSSTGS